MDDECDDVEVSEGTIVDDCSQRTDVAEQSDEQDDGLNREFSHSRNKNRSKSQQNQKLPRGRIKPGGTAFRCL